jgi:hypothetical protein
MTATWDRFLFWTPRVLAILFAGFLGIFAADVFDETQGFWSTAVALLLHLVPSGLILLILVIAWRHEWLGGLFYLAISLLFFVTSSGDRIAYAAISGPLALIALLFFAHWRLSRRSQLQQRPSS